MDFAVNSEGLKIGLCESYFIFGFFFYVNEFVVSCKPVWAGHRSEPSQPLSSSIQLSSLCKSFYCMFYIYSNSFSLVLKQYPLSQVLSTIHGLYMYNPNSKIC